MQCLQISFPVQSVQAQSRIRGGFSLVEVMIAMAVLAVGIAGVIGQIPSLNGLRRESRVVAEGQTLLDDLAQRFASANFDQLRTSALPWSYARPIPNEDGSWPGGSAWLAPEQSWVRPMNAMVREPGGPSLDDYNDGNNLMVQGFLKKETALSNVQVFIEYYRAMSWFDSASTEPSDRTAYPATVFPGIMRDPHNLGPDSLGRPMYGLLCEANPFKPVTVADFKEIMDNKDVWLRRTAANPSGESRPGREGYYLRVPPADLNKAPGSISNFDNSGNDHGYDSVLIRITVTWGGQGYLDMSSRNAVNASMAKWRTGRRLECWTGARSGKFD